MKVVDAVVEELVRNGVRRLYGVPGGGSNMSLIGTAAAHGIEFVLMHHEPAAVFAAAGEAESTGRPAVCISTLGPGVANCVNGLAHCLLDRVPLVLISDSPGDEQYLHQRLSQDAVVGGVVKRSEKILPETAAATVRAALADTVALPRGPVHLSLSPVVAMAKTDGAAGDLLPRPRGVTGSVADAAELLRRAEKPVVVAGLGATDPASTRALRAFAELLGAPVLTTYKAKGVFPERHPQAAGLVTNGALEGRVLGTADAIVAVGLDEVELMPGPWRWPQPTITVGEGAMPGGHLQAAVALDGPADEWLSQLAEAVADWTPVWRHRDLPHARPDASEVTSRRGTGIPPRDVAVAARNRAPAGTVATVDAGSHMFPATLFWEAEEPRRFLISNGLATMGYALPAAIGASLASPDRKIVCFTGDGGLAMVTGELETAARLRVPVVVVVFDDSMLNLIKVKQEKRRETTVGLDFGSIDWVSVAIGMGVGAERVTDPNDLESAFDRALAADGPFLLDVVVDPSSYTEMLHVIRG